MDEQGDTKEYFKYFLVYVFFIGIVFFILAFADKAFAYERVLFNEGPGYATSTLGASAWMKSGATTLNGFYFIDCDALNIAEIASTTVSLYVDTSTRTGFNIQDLASGRLSDNSYTITTTATDFSYTFTPPLWCDGSFVLLGGEEYATRPVNWSVKGATNVDHVPHAWCSGTGSACSTAERRGQDIAIIAVGSFSTSTGGGGCEDCLQANQIIVEDALNLIGGGVLVGVSFLFLISGIIGTIWIIRRFWR